MKKLKKILMLFFILNFIFYVKVFALNDNNIKIKELEYTEQYKEYLNLTDEEKKNVLQPNKYNYGSTTGTIDTMKKNNYIAFNNFVKYLRATASKDELKFSLKDKIAKNVVVKNQGTTNSCWAYASISSLETNLAMKNLLNNSAEKIYDFSEKHLVYSSVADYFNDGKKNKYGRAGIPSNGGTYFDAVSYLTKGIGAVSGAEEIFDDDTKKIDINEIQSKIAETTVNDIIYFSSIPKTSEANAETLSSLKEQMKEHISTCGSIYAGFYIPTKNTTFDSSDATVFNLENSAFYTDKTNAVGKLPNHAISIIGWDDEFSKDKFSTEPKENGAWIIKNSWGTPYEVTYDQIKELIATQKNKNIQQVTEEELRAVIQELIKDPSITDDKQNSKVKVKIGDDGLYYISYEDEYIYSQLMGITDANDTKTYDNIYQLDEVQKSTSVSAYGIQNSKETYFANVFTRENKTEYVTAVGTNVITNGQKYEVYINPDSSDKSINKLQKVELVEGDSIKLTAGYHTLKFKNAYKLTGSNFVIALKVTSESENANGIFEGKTSDDPNIKSSPNESFLGVMNGTDITWIDTGDPSITNNYLGNAAIKAIAQDTYNGTVVNESGKSPEPEPEKGKGSDYSNAVATVKEATVNKDDMNINITFEVLGIKVEKECDSYEHYFYITSDNNYKNMDNITNKAGKFEKQSNGTYKLTFNITSYDQLEAVTDDNAYVYIKEIATVGSEKITTLSNAINVRIPSSNYNEPEIYTEKVELTENSNEQYPTMLPNTGLKVIVVSILIVIIVGIVFYIKYRKLYDIK